MPRQLILNLISPLLIPGALIGGIYLCLTNLHKLPKIPIEVWQIGPHLCLAFLLLLSLAFNRSRIFYVAILITLLTGIPISTFPEALSSLIIYVLFPANIILILFYRERGVFTSMGLWRLALIVMLSAGIYTLGYLHPDLVQKV